MQRKTSLLEFVKQFLNQTPYVLFALCAIIQKTSDHRRVGQLNLTMSLWYFVNGVLSCMISWKTACLNFMIHFQILWQIVKLRTVVFNSKQNWLVSAHLLKDWDTYEATWDFRFILLGEKFHVKKFASVIQISLPLILMSFQSSHLCLNSFALSSSLLL